MGRAKTFGIALNLGDHFDLYLEDSIYVPFTGAPGYFANTNATYFGVQYNFSAPRTKRNCSAGEWSPVCKS